MRFFVVVPQKIFTPIVPQISPDRMDVIRVVLSVVILDKETGAMDSVIVGPFPLPRPRPRKMDRFFPFLLHPVHAAGCKVFRHTVEIVRDKMDQNFLLGFVHIRGGKADGPLQPDMRIRVREYVGRGIGANDGGSQLDVGQGIQ